MAVKSVIDIDVNDEQFKRFSDLFNKYKSTLDKMPGAWKKVGASTKKNADDFQTMTAALLAQNHLHKEIGTSSNQANQTLHRQTSLWNTIHRRTTGVFRNVTGIAKLLTEMGVGVGLGTLGFGIASLFGLRDMAKSADESRSFAQRTGTTTGQRFGFKQFEGSHLSNPDAILAAANLATTPGQPMNVLAKMFGFSTAGGPFAVANNALLAIQRRMHEAPNEAFKGLLMQQYGQPLRAAGFDEGDLMLLQSRTREHQEALTKRGILESHAAHLSDSAQWTAALRVFNSTFKNLGVTLKNDLVPLMPHIDKFINAAGRDLTTLLKSPLAKKAISDLSGALDKFTNYISSGGFTQSIKNFGDDVKGFDETMKRVGLFFKILSYATGYPEVHSLLKYLSKERGKGDVNNDTQYWRSIFQMDKKLGLPTPTTDLFGNKFTPGQIAFYLKPEVTVKVVHQSGTGADFYRAINSGH